MTLSIPSSSSSSSQRTAERAPHQVSFGSSDLDILEPIHLLEANTMPIATSNNDTELPSCQPVNETSATNMEHCSINNKNQRHHQQRKTWTPSSLSLKPFRSKPLGRNSLPSINTRKKKPAPSATFSGFFSSLASTSNLSSRYTNNVEPEKSPTPTATPPYRLSSFAFETTAPGDHTTNNNTSSSSTSRSSSTSTLSFSPSTHSLPQSVSTSTSTDNIPFTSSCISMGSHSTSQSDSANHPVGQLLFGTPIVDDPFFFKKEFNTIINSQQYRPPLSILVPKQDTCTDGSETKEMDLSFYQQKRQDDGLFLLKTMNLQRLLDDCNHIGQTTSQWVHDLENGQQDEQVLRLTLEWGYTNCNRILEQYSRLLEPESHIGDDNRKAWYAILRHQLENMENEIQDGDLSATGLDHLVHSLAHLIYDGILLTNYGRMVVPNKGFWIEGNNQCNDPSPPNSATPYTYSKIDHQDPKISWYSELFVGRPYSAFIGYKNNDPVVLTALWDTTTNNYRCIFRSTLGPSLCNIIDINHRNNDNILSPSKAPLPFMQTPTMSKEWKSAIEDAFDIDLSQLVQVDANFMNENGFELDLIRLDKDMIHHRFKCGVLYIKDRQCNEDDWFSNDCGSESFHDFLDCLGEKIALKGYQGWAAGLDTRSGDSGDYTYTSTWQDTYQVTYHISTLIPSSSNDKQHIQKKRHIGNDIVCIVFVDGNRPFDPAAIKSQFLHVFIVVHQEEWYGGVCWRVEVTCVKDVPLFGPPLSTRVFFDKTSLHQFLLAKLINAEYAALKAPKFTKPLDRARQGILTNVVERTLKNNNNNKHYHYNMKPLSRNAHVIAFPVFRTTPTSGRTTILKDLLSSEGIVGSLGRRKSAQDSLLVSSESKLYFGSQGQQSTETIESTPVLDITEIRPSRSSQAILQSEQQQVIG